MTLQRQTCTGSDECTVVNVEVKRLRREVRRLRTWMRDWRKDCRAPIAGLVPCVSVLRTWLDDALAGKAPRRAK